VAEIPNPAPSGFRVAAPARLPAPGSLFSPLDSLSASLSLSSSSEICLVASGGKESTGLSPTKRCTAAAMLCNVGAEQS
jgi:hypothetical protein